MPARKTTSSRPLIDLLQIAKDRGVIDGWSIDGPNFLFHRGSDRIAARAVSAGSVLRRLILEQEDADACRLDMGERPS